MKKGFFLAAVVSLALLLMPLAAFAGVNGVDVGGTSVANVLVNEDHLSTRGWAWHASTSTLMLNSNYNNAPSNSDYIYFDCSPTDTIRLIYAGNVTIDGDSYVALECKGNLEIASSSGLLTLYSTGDSAIFCNNGGLIIRADAKIDARSHASGVEVIGTYGDIIIEDNASVIVTSTGSHMDGIYSYDGSIVIDTTGSVTVDVLTAPSGHALYSGQNDIYIQKGSVDITVDNAARAFSAIPVINNIADVYVNGKHYGSSSGGGGGCNFGWGAYILIALAAFTLRSRHRN